jgi:uncharacterized protein YraI/heat shock protein HslJ
MFRQNKFMEKENMQKYFVILLSGVFILAFAVACTGGETATPEPTSQGTAFPEPTQESPTETEPPQEGLPAPEPVSMAEVVNINWQWSELHEAIPASQSLVPDPENYIIVFGEDSTFNFQADCNVGAGSYTGSMGSINLAMGPITLAACPEDSLSDIYLAFLGGVTGFGVREDKLVLVVNNGEAQMVFQNGGPAEETSEETESCADIQLASVSIDTGDLPDAWVANCLPATPYDNTQPPGPMGLPEHIEVNFGVENPVDLQPGDPIIYIIPVADYVEMWSAAGDDSVSQSIQLLLQLLQEKPYPIPTSGMPTVPFEQVAGVNDISAQGEYLDITMGNGVRFVGRFTQDTNPVTDMGWRYIFQGFSSDGEYLIIFFYPVSSSALPTIEDVPPEEMDRAVSDSEAYLAEKAQELSALAPSDWQPDLEALDAVITSLEYQKTPPAEGGAPVLTSIKWLWTDFIDPNTATTIPDSESYTLIFLTDGTFNMIADCNSGNGTYSVDGSSISLTVGAVTQAECGEGSLSNRFINLLGDVATYVFDQGRLILNLKVDAGDLIFANGGVAVIAVEPAPGAATATTTEPLNVRSGPGTAYSSYGRVPTGTTFEIIGISEDGEWLVVKIPSEVSTSGQGWISGRYLETENAEDVPIIPTPPLDSDGGTSPDPNTPMATTTDAVNVRSGPGTEYPSYGITPVGATAEVIGISEDGTWWVVKVPTELAPDGRGWLNANYVDVTNAENVPVIETPPLP